MEPACDLEPSEDGWICVEGNKCVGGFKDPIVDGGK